VLPDSNLGWSYEIYEGKWPLVEKPQGYGKIRLPQDLGRQGEMQAVRYVEQGVSDAKRSAADSQRLPVLR